MEDHSLSPCLRKLTDSLVFKNAVPQCNTFTDYELNLLYLRMKQDGTDRYIFCDGSVDSLEAFKRVVRDDKTWVYAGFSKTNHEPLGLAIFDLVMGKTVRLHYTFFRNPESRKNRYRYAKMLLDLVFENGTVDTIIMCTPSHFLHSNAMAKAVGAKFLGHIYGVVPRMNWELGTLDYGKDNLYTLTSPYIQEEA